MAKMTLSSFSSGKEECTETANIMSKISQKYYWPEHEAKYKLQGASELRKVVRGSGMSPGKWHGLVTFL